MSHYGAKGNAAIAADNGGGIAPVFQRLHRGAPL
jgi:hypothetical protein